MLYSEKAPFLLTILFSALAWTVSQVASDAATAPLLEYTKNTVAEAGRIRHVFTFMNISSQKAFSNLGIKLRMNKGSGAKCVASPSMNFLPPTELSDPEKEKLTTAPDYIDGGIAAYQIPMMQPGAVVNIVMFTDKDAPVDVYIWSESTVRLVKASLQTYIVKNRFNAMLWLIALWFVLILLYFILINRKNGPQKEEVAA